ncbi:MAG TPA: cytochrome c biogenesis protein ResB, partial [Gemmatales bacterium]|nr:cytochrome c biogenesis protein ResB [Gemmatales bacterium]
FELRLQRFEMQVDRGTNKPATYTSFVQLLDRGQGIHGANHVITMNQPLNHRGYKVYQSDYKFLLYDEVGRPVYYSGFTVGRDPGLWLKYLGSAMLALGITCMFYMKAYFFAPRRRPTETAAAGA